MRAHWLDDDTTLTRETLADEGIPNQALPLDADGYQPTLTALKSERGYETQDEIALRPDTENLDAICAKFKDEHHHTDDEVRFVLEGEGIFDIRSRDDRWMRVVVEAGDLIVVPAGTHHRFTLTDAQTIRCVRLFKDPAGWAPVYREAQT